MEYEQIFEVRGQRYHRAMAASPTARDAEFLQIFNGIDWSRIKRMLDYPAGGNYIRHLVPDHVTITSLDPSKVFSDASAEVSHARLDSLQDLPEQDLVINVATLHHVTDKQRHLQQLAQLLGPGGRLGVADVAAGSAVESYLENFVHHHTSTGHRGSYLAPDEPPLLEGCRLLRSEVLPCPWRFRTEQELRYFVLELFGLEEISPEEALDGLRSHVKVSRDASGWTVGWELLYLDYAAPRD